MSLTLRFLGTAASRPTVERNVSAIAVVREGETLMFDCGEGTQRQMMRYGVSFVLGDIFFTHFHADHVLGVIGLIRTMQLQARTESLRLWGPAGIMTFLKQAASFTGERLPFLVIPGEVTPGTPIPRQGYSIIPFAASHRGSPAVGYTLAEDLRLGRFHPDMARARNPRRPTLGRVCTAGRIVTLQRRHHRRSPAELVGPHRPGRRVVHHRRHPALLEVTIEALARDCRSCSCTKQPSRKKKPPAPSRPATPPPA